MEIQLVSALREAVDFLEESGYRYAIIGGIALSHWGFVRYTHDVDIKVFVPDTNYPAAREALRTAFPNPARQHIKNNPLIVAVYVEDVIVDFLLSLPGYEELIIERAVQSDFGGWLAWVCSAEDLIIQKVAAGRGKDWADVEALLIEQGGKLDEAYIDEWLSQFAEILYMPEILTRYQSLLKKAKDLI